LAEVFSAADVQSLAAALEPSSMALVVLWENTWAAPLALAARSSGGQLVAGGRVPIDALMTALGAGTEGA
jgi:hypothetical protein